MTGVIPFPGSRRYGHALKVALLLKEARTQREAEHIVKRTGQTFGRQLRAAGIPEESIRRETVAFLVLIRIACRACGSRWAPEPPPAHVTQGG
ncbi:hypothetical protein BTR14_03190 [Rhizobium rhizosphaerae]|uniref:Uncharacterized protein n=2 Tax=Xaviernesmea rhizosphaerae TaxID=1672749 RepID=A0ABX3PHQ9_9HYPH|nr:hypothetical protein BTR14_03190 [Xaviernesmea rhizosphaerae]